MAKRMSIDKINEVVDTAVGETLKEISDITDDEMHYEQDVALLDSLKNYIYVSDIPQLITWTLMNPTLWNQTLFFHGPSAIGKTFAVRQGAADAAKAMGRELEFHEKHVSQLGLTDVTGVPRPEETDFGNTGRTIFFPPKDFALQSALPEHQQAIEKFLMEWATTGATNYSILKDFKLPVYFWDEVTNGSTQNTVHQCFSLWYGNKVADNHLVSDAVHILAGNLSSHGTNSTDLAKSATSRTCMIPVVPSLAGWMRQWAMIMTTVAGVEQSQEHPTVIAFLHRNSRLFAPNSSNIPKMTPFPGPRTWSAVSKLMYANDQHPIDPDGKMLRACIAGLVGNEAANLFDAFIRYWEKLPNVNKLLNSPAVDGGPFGWLPDRWPTEPDIQYILGSQMIAMLNKDNAQRFMAFVLDQTKFTSEMTGAIMRWLRPAGKVDKLAHDWAREEFTQYAMVFQNFMIGQ